MQESIDPLVFGHRVRHCRRQAGLTLDELGERVGKPAPYLSMLENGKREPRLGLINALAEALDVSAAELLQTDPPNRRSRLEIGSQIGETVSSHLIRDIEGISNVLDGKVAFLLGAVEEGNERHLRHQRGSGEVVSFHRSL